MFFKNMLYLDSREKVSHTYLQWLITLLSSFLFFGYGLQIGWVSPMVNILQSDASPTYVALSDAEMAIVAAIATSTAIFGAPASMYTADLFGRKTAILVLMFVHALSWILKLIATNVGVLIAARICSGLMFGGCFSIIPMYVREISHDSIRGKLVSFAMSMQHIGVLCMYLMGSYCGYYTTLWIALSISIVSLLLMLLAPESPVFLVKKGEFDVATETVAKLRGLRTDDLNVQKEINYMKNEDSYYKSSKKITYFEICKNKAWRRGYIICQVLMGCVAANGTFGIVTYAWSIMTEAGVAVSPGLLSLVIPSLMMLSSLLPMTLVEMTGRKPLLAGMYLISALSLGCLASALLARRCGAEVPGWLHVICIAVTVSAYAGGVLPLPILIMNDIFIFQVRAKIISIVQMAVWGMLSLQVVLFDVASTALGLHSVFYVCAGVNLLGAMVVLVFVPETKNRTTTEIEDILSGSKSKSESAVHECS